MKAIIIKEDGLAYVNDLPEEPKHENLLHAHFFSWNEYEKAIDSAKESAILCDDQEPAKELLEKHHSEKWVKNKPFDCPKSGIYPIPGLEWTEEYQFCYNETAHERKVAILSVKETPVQPKITIDDLTTIKEQLGNPGISEIKIIESAVLPDNLIVVSSYIFKQLKNENKTI